MNPRRNSSVAVVILLLALAGCSHSYVVHPGAVNTFDSTSYDTLIIAHSAIESTKTDLANNVFSAAVAAKIKLVLNDLVTAYNVADTTYQAYHQALVAGTATPAQQSALSAQLSNVSTQLSNLTQAKAGH